MTFVILSKYDVYSKKLTHYSRLLRVFNQSLASFTLIVWRNEKIVLFIWLTFQQEIMILRKLVLFQIATSHIVLSYPHKAWLSHKRSFIYIARKNTRKLGPPLSLYPRPFKISRTTSPSFESLTVIPPSREWCLGFSSKTFAMISSYYLLLFFLLMHLMCTQWFS